tara:strand:- start:2158 stop:2754 length:597 start_codon:yes stop_codon:yes gene_type:complete
MVVDNGDYLNVIERKIIDDLRVFFNTHNSSANDGVVKVYGQFPEPEELKFPSVIVEQVGSGFEEKLMGESITVTNPVDGTTSSYTGELYGVAFVINILTDKESEFNIGTSPQGTTNAKYKQRRLLNWMMLNIANTINGIDWATRVTSSPSGLSYNPRYDGSVEVVESHLRAWRDVGYLPAFQWYGATAEFSLVFKNYR